MRLTVRRRCSDFTSYRAARVKSLFNCESGADFALDADLPIEGWPWRVGVIVGSSGSGKSSVLADLRPDVAVYEPAWADDRPIVDEIAPEAGFDAVPAALAAVGLGSVPAWLRPFRVLSLGEQFRAKLARLVAEAPAFAKVDEFTSVVDRQIAKVGALAFAKAWRRTAGQVVLATCHRDVLDWLQPCWTFDTDKGEFARGWVRRRPPIELQVHATDWRFWPAFEPHHYLKLPRMIAAQCYVGTVDGRPVAHVAVSTRPGLTEARACRLVVMPEWQGAGVGMRFLNAVCERWRTGRNRFRRRMPVLFHTSHPGLADALRRDPRWLQVSAMLHGDDKLRSAASMTRSGESRARPCGHGGHFRAVQGFRYYGEAR
jgi:GNAT superfamily N-acetyltransferase